MKNILLLYILQLFLLFLNHHFCKGRFKITQHIWKVFSIFLNCIRDNCNSMLETHPDYSSLRVFGSLCFPFTLSSHRTKFEIRAHPQSFLVIIQEWRISFLAGGYKKLSIILMAYYWTVQSPLMSC